MKIALLSVTDEGGKTAIRIQKGLINNQLEFKHYCFYKYLQLDAESFDSLAQLVGEIYNEFDALIFISACSIAVRSIASHIKSKCTDPAVIAVDEKGTFAVSLLSGHLGGANRLSQLVSKAINAVPVITTATDAGGKFSVDSFSIANDLIIVDMKNAKEVSAAVLNGEKIGLHSDYPVINIPQELTADKNAQLGICISDDEIKSPFLRTLNLVPKKYVLGIGCKKDTKCEVIEEHVLKVLNEQNISLRLISAVATIDIKRREAGLLDFCRKYRFELFCFSSEELMSLEGDFSSSGFVRETTGADNICERSAMLLGGKKLVIRKTAGSGVTAAVAEKRIIIDFEKEIL